MASTQYKYSILVTFAHQNTDLVKLGSVPVYYAPNKSDEFHFNKKSIRIYANRWKKIEDSKKGIYGTANAITLQIQKAVEFYYVTCPVLTKISAITIKYKTKTMKYEYQQAKEFTQPLPYGKGKFNMWCLKPDKVEAILQYGGNGPAYRNALSYCLNAALEDNSAFSKFSLLWRAYNGLYSRCARDTRDNKGLEKIREIINNSYHNLTKSNSNINNYRFQFSSLRWGKFLQNKISRDRLNGNYNLRRSGTYKFLTRFFDGGINEFLNQLLQGNQDLSTQIRALNNRIYNQAISHLNQWNIHNGLSNSDMLIILVTDYAYFLRNTLFHGAVDEPSFSLGETQEQDELKIASTWLENMIKDLIDNHLI